MVVLDRKKIKSFLDLGKNEVIRLQNIFANRQYYNVNIFKSKINYLELANEYQKIIDSGSARSKAELARYLGVSRAWITKVFKKASY